MTPSLYIRDGDLRLTCANHPRINSGEFTTVPSVSRAIKFYPNENKF